MTLDPQLLDQARTAAAMLAEAERTALLARADYHTAIRRLHLGGAPLREIAEALALSHQRVQQVVSAAGGSWWQAWRRRSTQPDAICTWCQRPPSEVAKLIAGPQVYICDACVSAIEQASKRLPSATRARCSFCRNRATEANPVASDRANICTACLRVCREILDSRVA